jgi:hypothetical protein
LQPGLTFVHPVTGFQVDSVHSIADFAILGPPIPVFVHDLPDDRSKNTTNISPVIDVGPATARHLKLTVLSANLPTAPDEIRTILETDYADRVSVVEFKAFASTSGP